MLFSLVKTDYLDNNFSKSLIRTEISFGGNKDGPADQQFMKISLSGSCWSSDC